MSKTVKNIILLIANLISVSFYATGQKFVYKNYTVTEGLPSSEVYHCLQDSKGYIWFATDNGVSRFDGYKFMNFDIQSGLVSNTILDLYEDFKGRIWFISLSGKLCYYQDSKIVQYKYNSKIITALKGYHLPIKQAFYIDSLDNIYYSVFNNGILKIGHDGSFENILDKRFGGNIYVANLEKGNSIVGTLEVNLVSGLVQNDKVIHGNIESLKSSQSLLFAIKVNDDELFLGCKNSIYKVKNNKIECLIRFHAEILWFSRDGNGNYWISVRDHGINFYKKPEFNSRPDAVYFPGKSISSVFIDNENAIWFTSLNEGVYYLPNNKIKCLDFSRFSSEVVYSVGLSRNKVWISHGIGKINSFGRNIDKAYDEFEIDATDQAVEISNNMQTDKIIIGTQHSIFSYLQNKLVNITKSLYNKSCRCILSENDHIFYVGTNYGFYKFDNGEIVYYSGENNVFKKIVYSMCKNDDKSIWIGTLEGLWKYENGKYINWASKNPLLSYRINTLFKYKNKLLIGTKGAGLVLMDLKDTSCKLLTIKDGLSSNSISSISGKDNEIWIGTNRGVSRLKYLNDNTFQISRIDAGTGLDGDEVNELIVDSNMLYVATKKGFSYINLNEFKWTDAKPSLHIEKVFINSNDTALLNNYKLNYYQNNVQISFVAISYKSNKNILYKYQLLPLDNDWKETNETTINYTNLPAGNYSLLIKARNESGIWSETDRTITFSIDKPFWKKLWFFVFPVFFMGLLIYTIFIDRINFLKNQIRIKKELNHYMQNAINLVINDHFLFNSLNSLNHLILSDKKLESSKLLSKISNYIRGILLTIRKDFISLYEEINILNLYLDIEKYRLKDRFVCNLEISKELNLNKIYVPGAFLIPFIEATIRSGSKSETNQILLNIHIKSEEGYLLINIKGNWKDEDNHKLKEFLHINSTGANDIITILKKRAQLINSFYNSNIIVEYSDAEMNTETIGRKVFTIKAEINKLRGGNLK